MELHDVPHADDLRIDVARPRPGVVRVLVAGELDGSTAPRLAAELDAELAADRSTVVALDLGDLGFCSVAGVAVLLRARERASAAGHTVVLAHLSPAVHRVVRACSLGAVLVEESEP